MLNEVMIGPSTNADRQISTARAGTNLKILSPRNSMSVRLRTKLDATRNPLSAKNIGNMRNVKCPSGEPARKKD